MNIKCVIDSSTLISLAKIDVLYLLEKMNFSLVCPKEVYTETVSLAILHGYPEGIEIKKLFDTRKIVTDTIDAPHMKGISAIDSKVIHLAKKINAIVLANDVLLRRNAIALDLSVCSSPDILSISKEKKLISDSEFIVKIKYLVSRNRLSEKTANEYLKGD